jgi:hypothetical protein
VDGGGERLHEGPQNAHRLVGLTSNTATTNGKQQAASSKQQAASSKQQAASSKQQAASSTQQQTHQP